VLTGRANESSNIFIHFGLFVSMPPTIVTSLFSILAKLSQKREIKKLKNAQNLAKSFFLWKMTILTTPQNWQKDHTGRYSLPQKLMDEVTI
jgi:hypothetical protein